VNGPQRFAIGLAATALAAAAIGVAALLPRPAPRIEGGPIVDQRALRDAEGHRSASGVSARADGGLASGEAGLPPELAVSAVEIPERLPDFTLANRDGHPTSISTWRGKSLIVNFWATWCAPCRREIPLLESLDAEWNRRNVAVIGIAVDHREAVLAFAQQFHIAYPLLIGEQDALDAATAVGVATPVLPFTVFTDRRGEVVAVFVGELHRPQADLILREVKALDDDHIALPAARQEIAAGLDALGASKAG